MNAFLRWLIGPKIPDGAVGVVVAREFNYLRLNGQVKVPPQWIEPLRPDEDGIVGPVRVGEPREYHPDAISRIRAEEKRAKAKAVEQEFVNQLQEVLS